MYIPKYSATADLKLIKQLINDYGFGTLITSSINGMSANHYPFLLSEEGEDLILWTHLARSNPQWKELNQAECLAIFNGAHAYISPAYYLNPLNVPTWNYTAVHAKCISEIIDDHKLELELMKKLVKFYEDKNRTSWNYDLPKDFHDRLLKAIIWVKLKVVSIDGKFKLSQNREKDDYDNLIKVLSKNSENTELVNYMRLTTPTFN